MTSKIHFYHGEAEVDDESRLSGQAWPGVTIAMPVVLESGLGRGLGLGLVLLVVLVSVCPTNGLQTEAELSDVPARLS